VFSSAARRGLLIVARRRAAACTRREFRGRFLPATRCASGWRWTARLSRHLAHRYRAAGFAIPHGERRRPAARPECAPAWQPSFAAALPRLRLTCWSAAMHSLYLGKRRRHPWRKRCALPGLPARILPLRSSWRNRRWLKNNPWFERRVIPGAQGSVDAWHPTIIRARHEAPRLDRQRPYARKVRIVLSRERNRVRAAAGRRFPGRQPVNATIRSARSPRSCSTTARRSTIRA